LAANRRGKVLPLLTEQTLSDEFFDLLLPCEEIASTNCRRSREDRLRSHGVRAPRRTAPGACGRAPTVGCRCPNNSTGRLSTPACRRWNQHDGRILRRVARKDSGEPWHGVFAQQGRSPAAEEREVHESSGPARRTASARNGGASRGPRRGTTESRTISARGMRGGQAGFSATAACVASRGGPAATGARGGKEMN